MKTVLINCSPKKRFCASAYFLFLQRLFVGGEKVNEKLIAEHLEHTWNGAVLAAAQEE